MALFLASRLVWGANHQSKLDARPGELFLALPVSGAVMEAIAALSAGELDRVERELRVDLELVRAASPSGG